VAHGCLSADPQIVKKKTGKMAIAADVPNTIRHWLRVPPEVTNVEKILLIILKMATTPKAIPVTIPV
jgi:hypothetical protein